MRSFKIILFFSILFIFSCNSDSSSDVAETPDVETLIAELKESNSLDKEKVNQLLTSIDSFVANDAESKKTPEYLELKAKYLTALGKNQEALSVYKTLYTKYKSYENSSDALFMMAFIYENNLNDKTNAEINYKNYLNEFPNGEFAKDAQFSIENINLTPEQLMQKFEEMNKNKVSE